MSTVASNRTDRLKRALLVLAILLGETGCERVLDWRVAGTLPRSLQVSSVCALSPSSVLIGGFIGEIPTNQSEAAIYYWDGNTLQHVYQGKGDVLGFAPGPGGSVYANLALMNPGGGFANLIVRSSDSGKSFRLAGQIPGGNWTQLVSDATGALWALGSGKLAVSQNDGETWEPVVVPGRRDTARERVIPTGRDVLLIGPRVFLLRSGKEVESLEVDTGGVLVTAGEGSTVAGVRDDRILIGTLHALAVSWFADFARKDGAEPIRVRRTQEAIRLLTGRELVPIGNSQRLFTSLDEGRSWSRKRIQDVHMEGSIDLTQSGRLVGVDYARRFVVESH